MADIRIGVVGATGYAGVELVRLLSLHPNASLAYLSSESQDGQLLSTVYPHLTGYADITLKAFDPEEAAECCDVVFLARGNGWAMKHAGRLLEAGCKVVDVAADFRLESPDIWEKYYRMPHDAQMLLGEAVYGLPELHHEGIRQARLVANPGCYPTSAILALAPAVAGRWIETGNIVINSASGVSGAGRSRTEPAYLYGEIEQNFRAYGVNGHRHTPEIEQELSGLAGEAVTVTFTPHLAPMTRGIFTTIYAELAEGADEEDVRLAYEDFYQDAPFVRILPAGALPETKHVLGSNYCLIAPVLVERTRRLVVLSVIDNLVKGASGQAIQNMNLMFGLDENAGLNFPAVYP
ncbi:MAG: N-acetyl-gamma-glutamyl-phosphate reductase [Armatimonadetes bacterium]|nr:N-acetyl-gamma-glutamyl-phosphate reductase [Armatimonadota bacterium]